jgi:hypothetical protein
MTLEDDKFVLHVNVYGIWTSTNFQCEQLEGGEL